MHVHGVARRMWRTGSFRNASARSSGCPSISAASVGEPALRAGAARRAAGEPIVQADGQTVGDMAFGHPGSLPPTRG